ncbi:MAG: substrate-binding domain-containing protein [Rhodospirillales bacterium]
MSRQALRYGTLTALAAASVAPFAPAALAAPVVINGGGAASQYFDYAAPDVNGNPVSEMSIYNAGQSKVSFGTYWSTISGAAQAAMLTNDLSCLENKVTGANGGNCNGTVIGGPETVHYGVSESVLSSTQIASWATSSVGQIAAGNLIQIPAMGTGLAIVVNDTNITQNGQAGFSDNDLCGIFSGLITDFSQITDSTVAPAAGQFKLLYRSDTAGNTFSLTNHLAAVCNGTNTNAGVTFTATSSFSALFPGGVTGKIPNAVGISGLSVLANTLAGLAGGAYPQAISYISPDWTSVDSATSSARLSDGAPSPLIVAALRNGTKLYLPTTSKIAQALTHPTQGQNLTPPVNAAQGANPALWVPIIQKASTGYPIVSYSVLELPQCYASIIVRKGVIGFLKDHFNDATYKTVQSNNGLVPVANSGAAKFLAAIKKNIVANANKWNTNIGNGTVCAGKAGR